MSANYETNFFKPKTKHGKVDMKITLITLIIWFLMVFGFQVLLIILGNPTPEPAYNDFSSTWPAVIEKPDITKQEQIIFAKSLLAVLGKNVSVKPNDKKILKESFSWIALKLIPVNQQSTFSASMLEIKKHEQKIEQAAKAKVELTAEEVSNLKSLIKAKKDELSKPIIQALGLGETGFDVLLSNNIPYALVPMEMNVINEETIKALPVVMKKYLIHNRSFLTDTTFLGFPFNYWYTSQFLLIMFIVMCIVYTIVLHKTHKKLGYVED